MGQPNAKARIRALLAEINYDFNSFNFNDIARWLEKQRKRLMIFLPLEIPFALYGACVKNIDKDYSFFDQTTIFTSHFCNRYSSPVMGFGHCRFAVFRICTQWIFQGIYATSQEL